jgi:hypothetical protein
MAEHRFGDEIEPELANHLMGSMGEAPGPEPKRPAPPTASGGTQWPDGSGKRRHPKDNDAARGRAGQEAAAAAVHRTARPDVRHSS